MEFGDGAKVILEAGGMARVDAATPRKVRNAGREDAIYLIAGGKDGYVGRTGGCPRASRTGSGRRTGHPQARRESRTWPSLRAVRGHFA